MEFSLARDAYSVGARHGFVKRVFAPREVCFLIDVGCCYHAFLFRLIRSFIVLLM